MPHAHWSVRDGGAESPLADCPWEPSSRCKPHNLGRSCIGRGTFRAPDLPHEGTAFAIDGRLPA
jgi:hypothetical protein